MSPAKKAHHHDVEVTWEDQQKICAFGRLTGKAHGLQSLVSAKEVIIHLLVLLFVFANCSRFDFPKLLSLRLIITFDSRLTSNNNNDQTTTKKRRPKQQQQQQQQKRLEDAEEAEGEIAFLDESDETCQLVLGECFVQTSQKSAETQLQRAVETQTKEVDAHKKELETVRDAMKELKGHLYAKFGSSINLEDD